MNSKERVLSAVAHIEPDKVPVDLGSTPSSGISAIAYSNLLKYLKMEHLPVQIYDVVQQLAQPHDEILELFGIDAIDIGRAFNKKPKNWRPTILANGDKAFYPAWFNPEKQENGEWIASKISGQPIARMPAGASFFDQITFPWTDDYPENMDGLDDTMYKVMWAAFALSPWDNSTEPDFWEQLRKKAIKLKEDSDKALIIGVGCNLFE